MSRYKTLNTNEDIPEVFYIYVGLKGNISRSINHHNYAIDKKIKSKGYCYATTNFSLLQKFIDGDIDYLPYIINPNKTMPIFSSYEMTKTLPYSIEYNLEVFRKNNYRKYPSRFSCVYAFGDEETAIKYGPKKGGILKKFKLLSLRELLKLVGEKDKDEYKLFDDAIKVVKCDMDIINAINNDIALLNGKQIDYICDLYWSGKKNVAFKENPIDDNIEIIREPKTKYEYLIEGILVEIDDKGEMMI